MTTPVSPSLSAAAPAIQEAATHIDALAQQGWTIGDDLSSVRLSLPIPLPGQKLAGVLKPLVSLALGIDLSGEYGYRLGVSNQKLSILDAPQTPGDYFYGAELGSAQRAAEGDVDAALQLSQGWTGTVDIDLAQPLRASQPDVFWRVLRSSDVLTKALRRMPWWKVADLIRDQDGDRCRPVVYIALNEPTISYKAQHFAVQSITETGVPERRLVAPSGTATPRELWPIATTVDAAALEELLSSHAGALAWVSLADGWTSKENEATLEFFGFRRVYGTIHAAGVTDVRAQKEVAELYDWAMTDASPDRLLAIRQVCSLYQEGEFIEKAADVLRAAEPIYAGLRSEAVAEVFATHRDARTLGLTVARQGADAALTAAKSVAERTLAAAAGIGGVALARASSSPVKQELADRLMLGIAAFTGFLLLWSIIIEGPAMAAPLRTLKDDLKQFGDILTPAQRKAITELSLVKSANRRVLVTRIAAPLVYVTVGVIALIVR